MEDSKSLDWANLARYEDDNLKVGLPKKDERRVVFMGDSITEEWSNLYQDYFNNCKKPKFSKIMFLSMLYRCKQLILKVYNYFDLYDPLKLY